MIRIPLENAFNVRDLGYYAAEGGMTKSCKFLRGDVVCNLTEKEVDKLISYGVKTVIDLRSDDEVVVAPNSFFDNSNIKYYNIGVLENIDDQDLPIAKIEENCLGKLYIYIIENCVDKVLEVFNIIADSMDGCTLYHCKAGKDRTGVISALLLDLAGVDYYDIIANYEVTHTYIRKNMANVLRSEFEVKNGLGFSNPINMEMFLEHLYKKYGNATKYLKAIGLAEAKIEHIKQNFIELI